jgi:predicted hotdog family 3-hydroxylacyl-ACP dehydratase
MIISKANITSLIPQRPPFVMIDRLIWNDEKKTRTAFVIEKDNIFLENGWFTEPGLVENIAQTAAARAGYMASLDNLPVRVGYIGALKNLIIYSLPIVDEELETEITLQHQIFDVSLVSGKVTCNRQVIAECEMKIFITPSK